MWLRSKDLIGTYALIYLRKQYVSVFFDRKGDLQTAHFQYNSLRNIFKFWNILDLTRSMHQVSIISVKNKNRLKFLYRPKTACPSFIHHEVAIVSLSLLPRFRWNITHSKVIKYWRTDLFIQPGVGAKAQKKSASPVAKFWLIQLATLWFTYLPPANEVAGG